MSLRAEGVAVKIVLLIRELPDDGDGNYRAVCQLTEAFDKVPPPDGSSLLAVERAVDAHRIANAEAKAGS